MPGDTPSFHSPLISQQKSPKEMKVSLCNILKQHECLRLQVRMQYGTSIRPCQVSPGQFICAGKWHPSGGSRPASRTRLRRELTFPLTVGWLALIYSPPREGSIELFFFDFLPLLSSGKKNKNKNVFRIQRQQYLWLVQGSSPSPGCPVFHCRLYWIYLFSTMWSPLQYGCACLRHQGDTTQHCLPGYNSLLPDSLPGFEEKGQGWLLLSSCLCQFLQRKWMFSPIVWSKHYYYCYLDIIPTLQMESQQLYPNSWLQLPDPRAYGLFLSFSLLMTVPLANWSSLKFSHL